MCGKLKPREDEYSFVAVAQECLPSGVQLCKRQILVSGECVFYGRMESISHALLFCQFARSVWREVKMLIPFQLRRNDLIYNSGCLSSCLDLLISNRQLWQWVSISSGRHKMRWGTHRLNPIRSVRPARSSRMSISSKSIYLNHSLKNHTGNRTAEAVGSPVRPVVYWFNVWTSNKKYSLF
jgi:hypothetical protein